MEFFQVFALLRGRLAQSSMEATLERTKMKKLIALMALVGMFAVGCKTENKGGTSDGNYSTSDSSKMQSQPSTTTTTTNSTSGTQTQP